MMLATVAAVAAFNLVCTGTVSTKTQYESTDKPYSSTYRIDLNQKKWCEDDCKGLHDIADVQPASIALTDKKVDAPSEKSEILNLIDRETGEHHIYSTYRTFGMGAMLISTKYEGQCERQPFSGFPEFKTKF